MMGNDLVEGETGAGQFVTAKGEYALACLEIVTTISWAAINLSGLYCC